MLVYVLEWGQYGIQQVYNTEEAAKSFVARRVSPRVPEWSELSVNRRRAWYINDITGRDSTYFITEYEVSG